MLPPLHYQGLSAPQPFGYQPPVAVPGGPLLGGPLPPQVGAVRSADQMDDAGDVPPAKRQKVAKLPGGQYYPEQDWINMHPVRGILSIVFGSFSPTHHDVAPYLVTSSTSERSEQARMEARWKCGHVARATAEYARINAPRPYLTSHWLDSGGIQDPARIGGDDARQREHDCELQSRGGRYAGPHCARSTQKITANKYS
jgi:hypothetical protein